ncbi:MAG: PHP domain-containing protein [Chloroflexi bacterium]|nr:PHP domain-containing protein [Chloroflexota bacterium]
MLKADFHIHSVYSMDCSSPLEKIIERCQRLGINCIALADHGTVEGALKLQRLAPFRVIVAEEVLTPHGEIMGMFLRETIPSGISVPEAIARIREQGGLVSIPHPFDAIRPSALEAGIMEDIARDIDLIEVFNARTILTSARARQFARKHSLPGSGGSDAHTLGEIGNAFVEMPDFQDKNDFLAALRQGKITGKRTSILNHASSTFAKLKTRFMNHGPRYE